MSLTFGGATSDRVNCGTGTALANLSTYTWIGWVNLTTITNGRHFFAKTDSSTPFGGKSLRMLTSGAIRADVTRSTTGAQYIANTGSLTTGAWTLLACSYDAGAASGEVFNIYTGSLTALATEVGYSTTTNGSGSTVNDNLASFKLGNNDGETAAMQGQMGPVAMFNRVLTIGEVRDWQFNPRMMAGCVGFWDLGDNGTGTQPDLSGTGNNGTVTGATQSANPPLRRRWGRRVLAATPSAATADATITPTGLAVTASLGTPVVSGGAAVAPTGLGMSMSLGTPVTSGGATIAPTGLGLTTALGTPVVSGGSAQAPTGLSVTASLGTPVVSGGATLLPTGLAMTAELGIPAISAAGGVTVLPTATTMTASLGTPVVSGASAVSVTGLGVTASLGTPVVTGGATLAPAGLGLSADLGTPFVSVGGAASISIVGIAMSADLGSPVVSVSREVTPAGLALSTALGVPVLTIGATVTPVGLELIAYLTKPTVVADIPNSTVYTVTRESGVRYPVTRESGVHYPITRQSGPRYDITREG